MIHTADRRVKFRRIGPFISVFRAPLDPSFDRRASRPSAVRFHEG
jgi:hypothetical protein